MIHIPHTMLCHRLDDMYHLQHRQYLEIQKSLLLQMLPNREIRIPYTKNVVKLMAGLLQNWETIR